MVYVWSSACLHLAGVINPKYENEGGAVAEWCKALPKREKINENQKIPGSPPGLGTFFLKKSTKMMSMAEVKV